jgi:hypothetical protein
MDARKKFERAVAEAAAHIDHGVADPSADWFPTEGAPTAKPSGARPENERKAQAQAEAAFAAVATTIGAEHGCSIIWKKPRAARKRTSAEYKFWRRPVLAFIEDAGALDIGPTELARRYDPTEPTFTVTKDIFRAPLSQPSRKEAGALLKARGYDLKLPANFSIRDIQKALKDRRGRVAGVSRFNPQVEIVGDTVFCDGKSFKMQPTGSGKMRIRAGNAWLSVETLKAFLAGQT